jgi:DNA-binding MarR family transcriptional regulator
LFHLSRNEGCNQATLAEVLDVEPITLARVLDRLELAGWVERRPDPTDRRARLLFLKPEALPIMEQLQGLGAETRAVALAGISEAEHEQLMTLLGKVRRNLSTRDAVATDAA